MRRSRSLPYRYRLLARFVVTVSGLLAVACLLTTVPWYVALALLAVVATGAGLWTLGSIASLPADEEGGLLPTPLFSVDNRGQD
jgi:hypothetical protein